MSTKRQCDRLLCATDRRQRSGFRSAQASHRDFFAWPKSSTVPRTANPVAETLAAGRTRREPPPPPDSRCARPLPSWRAIPCASNRPRETDSRPRFSAPGASGPRPARGENVALISLITVAFSSWASRVAGRTSASSRRQRSMISCRERGTRSYDALMTSCRYWPRPRRSPRTRASC